MLLHKLGEVSANTNCSIEMEKMADDLLMITVNNDTQNLTRFFNYWRFIGNGQNPPLEIGIDIDKNIIHSITLFIERDNFISSTIINYNSKKGNVIIDSNIFNDNRYIDVEGLYYVSINDKTFMCLFNNDARVNESVINGRVEYYISDNNELIGFAICNLNNNELEELLDL